MLCGNSCEISVKKILRIYKNETIQHKTKSPKDHLKKLYIYKSCLFFFGTKVFVLNYATEGKVLCGNSCEISVKKILRIYKNETIQHKTKSPKDHLKKLYI